MTDHATAARSCRSARALAYRAIPLQAAYCGAKFGIRGFTDSIRTELLHEHSKVQITMVQLPGVNTTQFNWCRSKLPEHPKPVPPIYQPEIPAEAVYWAAHHRRRELWVGYQRGGGDPRQQARAELSRRPLPRADRVLRPAGRRHARRRRARGEPLPADGARGRDTRHLRRAGQVTQPADVGCHPPAATRRRRRRCRCRGWRARSRASADERYCGAPRRRRTRTSCASTRCLPTASAEFSSDPHGDFVWMCFPRWDSEGVFSSLDRWTRGATRSRPPNAMSGAATTSRGA